MANRTKFTKQAKCKFIEVLRDTCNVSEAARAIGVSRGYAYQYKGEHADFSCLWDEAEQEAVDAVEMEARRRGVEGWEEPVFYKGEQCGTIRRYSDRMLELLLKAHRPEKYADRKVFTGKDGGPVAMSFLQLVEEIQNEPSLPPSALITHQT
jgi:hypothetical protein